MQELAMIALTGFVSFIGTYSAMRVHMQYLRRDVDKAHERIDDHVVKFH